jgi:HlyD family secretion protein
MNEKEEENKSIFRPAAIEHYSNASQFEQTFLPIRYKKWIIRGSLTLLLIGALIWFFFGTLPIEAQGVGIAVNIEGLSNVETSFNGVVKGLNVGVGESVQQGDLLAVLSNPEIEARLNMTLQTIENLQKRIDHLREEVEKEKTAEKKAISEEIAAANYKIQVLEKEIPVLQADVYNKEDLAARGLFDSQSLQESKELLWSKQTDLEKTKANLFHLHFLLKKGYRQQEIDSLQEMLLTAMQEKSLYEAQLNYKNIYSPVSGVILEWFIHPNKYVAAGDLIARLEIHTTEKSRQVFYGYLPVEIGRKVRLNAEVAIELTTVKQQEYGAILGNIISISPYAISPESLTRLINNPALIQHFMQQHAAVIEVVIEPQLDPSTISGYRWTSGEGPPIQLTSGTLCTFKGLVEEVRPYLYVIPAWWIKKIFHSSSTSDKKNQNKEKLEYLPPKN